MRRNTLMPLRFTDKTVESVLQDIYSTLYLTNIESMLIAETTVNLKDKTTNKHQQKVNHSVSFRAIKTKALNLLFSKLPISKVLNKLRKLFVTNPTLDKKSRQLQERLKLLVTCCITIKLNVNMYSKTLTQWH